MPRVTQVIDVEKYIIKWRLWTSLLMIFAGAVIASKFNSWYAIGGCRPGSSRLLPQSAVHKVANDGT